MNPRPRGTWPGDDVVVTGIDHDDRRLPAGGVFVCVRGATRDGHDLAERAMRRGACLVVGERDQVEHAPHYLQVDDSRKALALLAGAWYGHPSRRLTVIGVTGTNGKSSVTWMVQSMAAAAGKRAAVFGTLGIGSPDQLRPQPFTTPAAPDFQGELARLADDGYEVIAVEVSSHGLEQRRTYGTRFPVVAFTNLSQDHLDFHGDMDSYAAAKGLLFRSWERGPEERPALAVVNGSDPYVGKLLDARLGDSETETAATDDDVWLLYDPTEEREPLNAGPTPEDLQADPAAEPLEEEATAPKPVESRERRWKTLTQPAGADIEALEVEPRPEGLFVRVRHPLGEMELQTKLLGIFQAQNLLTALGVGLRLGLDPEAIRRGLEATPGIPGRMERVDRGQPFHVVVDYAHTPEALMRAVESLRPFVDGRIVLVFGCGGERDQGKRFQMGRVATFVADQIVVTDDNPRGEDPARIRAQVIEGIHSTEGNAIDCASRERAIDAAFQLVGAGDAVFIAGKGHETMQIQAHATVPFDDREVAGRLLEEMGFTPEADA